MRQSDSLFGGKEKKRFNHAQIEWNNETLTPFTKDFYTEHPSISNKTDGEIEEFRKKNSMIIHGSNINKPFDTFEHSGLPGMN